MNVKELIAALQALGPEYEESMVLVDEPGMGGPGEAKRFITIPEISGLWEFDSYDRFEKVVYICTGGYGVSKQAEEEGWKVPYYNPVNRTPLPPKPPTMINRHYICRDCLKELQKTRLRNVQKIPYNNNTCCHCSLEKEIVATTVFSPCDKDHGIYEEESRIRSC